MLGIAFLIKAGAWPLNFWLPGAYGSAGAPVAAVFSILTKVGIYAVLRIGSLLPESIAFGPFGGEGLFYGGLATMVFGMVGMLTTQRLNRLVAFSVVLSSGTVLAACALRPESSYCARAFLHVEFGVRERRLFHADGNDRPHRVLRPHRWPTQRRWPKLLIRVSGWRIRRMRQRPTKKSELRFRPLWHSWDWHSCVARC